MIIPKRKKKELIKHGECSSLLYCKCKYVVVIVCLFIYLLFRVNFFFRFFYIHHIEKRISQISK